MTDMAESVEASDLQDEIGIDGTEVEYEAHFVETVPDSKSLEGTSLAEAQKAAYIEEIVIKDSKPLYTPANIVGCPVLVRQTEEAAWDFRRLVSFEDQTCFLNEACFIAGMDIPEKWEHLKLIPADNLVCHQWYIYDDMYKAVINKSRVMVMYKDGFVTIYNSKAKARLKNAKYLQILELPLGPSELDMTEGEMVAADKLSSNLRTRTEPTNAGISASTSPVPGKKYKTL